MKLVDNWQKAYRWFSIQAFGAIMVLPPVWAAMPADVKAYLPESWKPWILVGLAAAGIIGRLIDQGSASGARP